MNRADRDIDELGNAWKGGFFAGESVVKVGGVGALMGTKPRLPFPGCDALCLREGFIGDGRRGPPVWGFKADVRAEEEFSTGCKGSGDGSRRGCDFEIPLLRGEGGRGRACSVERAELMVSDDKLEIVPTALERRLTRAKRLQRQAAKGGNTCTRNVPYAECTRKIAAGVVDYR